MDRSANVNDTGPAAGLGRLLVARGKLAEADLQRAERVLGISGGTLGQVLVRLGLQEQPSRRRCWSLACSSLATPRANPFSLTEEHLCNPSY